MDDARFDHLTRHLARRISRRTALGAGLGAGLVGLAGRLARRAAAQPATPSLAAAPATLRTGGQVVGLAPDGRAVAALTSDGLCLFAVPTGTRRVCGDLAGRQIQVEPAYVAWSPDSRRLALAETTLRTFRDGDLWLMTAATGQLTDLTPDGFHNRPYFSLSGQKPISGTAYEDVLPAWSPDGTALAFSRSPFVDGNRAGTVLVVRRTAGGPVRTVTTVSPDLPGALVYGLAWAPDGRTLYYTDLDPTHDATKTGVYAVGVDGTGQRKLLGVDRRHGAPLILGVGATGTWALIGYTTGAPVPQPDTITYALLALPGGRVTVLTPRAGATPSLTIPAATFSPAGTTLLYAVQPASGGGARLIARDLTTGAETVVATVPRLVVSTLGQGLTWARNGTVAAQTARDAVTLVALAPRPR